MKCLHERAINTICVHAIDSVGQGACEACQALAVVEFGGNSFYTVVGRNHILAVVFPDTSLDLRSTFAYKSLVCRDARLLLNKGVMKMRMLFLSCTVIGLVLLSACAPSAVTTPTPTVILTATSTLTPTDTPSPVPTATNTPLPLTHLDLWLSIEDDPAAPPIGKLKVNSVSALYIWAKAPEGVEGDFSLEATLQDGLRDQLGPTFHASPGGQTIDCGLWEGGFLTTRGTMTLEAYSGNLLLGTFTFSID